MTDDLERLWDDLPVGPAPTERILAAARASAEPSRPEQRLRRSLTRVGVVGGIAAAFVAGVVVAQSGDSGGSGGPGGSGLGDAAPVAFHGALKAAPSCDALLKSYIDRALDVVGPYGWQGAVRDQYLLRGPVLDGLDMPRLAYAGADDIPTATKELSAVAPQRATSSDTGTNVQEAGVDEPDVVKTDGDVLVRLQGSTLVTYDVSGTSTERLGDVDLDDFHHGQLLLAGDTVVAVGDDGTEPQYQYTPYVGVLDRVMPYGSELVPQTRVVSIDLSDPADPEVTHTVDYSNGNIDVRQHGDDIRLALTSGLPDLDFATPGRRGKYPTNAKAKRHNEQVVRETTLADWLPTRSVDGGDPEQFLDCGDVAQPRDDVALGTMTVAGFSAGAPDDVEAIGVATDTQIAYESADHLYLAAADVGEDAGTTHLYDFAIKGTGASYVGDGQVDGRLADRWSMDEKDGVLRLAVEPTQQTGDFTSLVTMKVDGGRLVELGRLDNLGHGQQLKAVRWFDNLALLVTFRQIDPLYAVDLADQAHPKKLGELKIPGYSDYLHPLGPYKVIGVGEGREPGHRWGAQAALFNLGDVEHPKQISVAHFPGMQAQVSTDPRQFTWLPEQRVALTVLSQWRSRRIGHVAVLTLSGGKIHSRTVQVEYGDDVDDVRLVPLPDGKVALVTGDDVRMFDYS